MSQLFIFGNLHLMVYGKVLIAGGYLILDPAYSGIVLRANAQIICEIKSSDQIKIVTEFGNYPERENLFISACLFVSQIYFDSNDIKCLNFEINVVADPVFYLNGKIGIGSSSAFCTSLIHAILKFHNISDDATLFKIASLSHFMAQGKIGSGFDICAAVFGSCIYRKPLVLDKLVAIDTCSVKDALSATWDIDITTITWPSEWFVKMFAFSKGQPTIVNAGNYLEWRSSQKGCISELDAIEFTTKQISTSIDLKDHVMLKSAFVNLVDQYHQLGIDCNIDIIPRQCRLFFENAFKLDTCIGGMCPGAGGNDAIFAITTCENDDKLIKMAKDYGFDLINVSVYYLGALSTG
eukprot:NODE_104_length_19952_cov_0.449000.p3 type:complete len:351 gc:universal NODE_104_length_19952_cov_0.449000:11289-12341(+)